MSATTFQGFVRTYGGHKAGVGTSVLEAVAGSAHVDALVVRILGGLPTRRPLCSDSQPGRIDVEDCEGRVARKVDRASCTRAEFAEVAA